MRRFHKGVLAAASVVVLAALTVAVLSDSGAGTSHAEFNVDDPMPGKLQNIAVDANTSGNAPADVGTVDDCRAVNVGDVFDIDIVVDEIAVEDGVSGLSFNLVYDPAILEITSESGGEPLLFMVGPGNGAYNNEFGDPLPDTDGDYRHEGIDLGGTGPNESESGEGVLARLTIEAVGAGTSVLDLTDTFEFDFTPNVNSSAFVPFGTVDNVLDAEVHVGAAGGTCPGGGTPGSMTPTPTQGPATPTPTSTPDGSETPTGTPTNTPAPTSVGQTPSPTSIPTPTPTGGVVTPTPTPTDTGGATQELMGDSDCDGEISSRDNQALLREVLDQNPLSQTEPCPDLDSPVNGDGNLAIWGDWDCDGEISSRDNQALLRAVLDQNPLSQTEPCPDIGTLTSV